MRNTTDVTARWSTSDCQLDCFHFRLEVACPSLFSWPSAEISVISFRKRSAVYSLWEDPKVSVQLVDKRSSDGISEDGSVCALLAIFALQTDNWGGGGRVNVCFHISTKGSIWYLNRLQLSRMATNIYFFKIQSRNNILFCALYCVLILRCRQRTTEIKELSVYNAMMFENNPVGHLNALG